MSAERPRIVAHTREGILYKGFPAESTQLDYSDVAQRHAKSLPSQFSLHLIESGKVVELQHDELKALYFVRSFEGRHDYNEVKFFEAHPAVEGLWVRLRFHDGEVTEGVIYNSLGFLVEPGFFLKPPDPNSNNQILYVVKSSLQEFRILGVRGTY